MSFEKYKQFIKNTLAKKKKYKNVYIEIHDTAKYPGDFSIKYHYNTYFDNGDKKVDVPVMSPFGYSNPNNFIDDRYQMTEKEVYEMADSILKVINR